ncbi:hypothetical protein QWY90_06180 [Flavobacterium paronense]|uniref:DUF1772 domain-containing protein n=1 Tax=Flavobacterium paronense TaxID=1392775 RepID=A0ABV5GCJ5_9FLAO|nr:hypothetical protein [Flavobacterium paronense]MDN3676894.1 hypothetical protein [Flavobacterium paronense]
MFKKTFLFITTLLVATSASTGYNGQDLFKGDVPITRFLDWFKNADHYVHLKGLIILDLIPAVFLIVQTVLFFKDKQKLKGWFALLSLLANGIGVVILVQYAYPIAAQMADWTPDTLPSNWISLKDDWIQYIGFYALLGILGLLLFLITFFVPANKNTALKPIHPFLNGLKNALLFILTFLSLMNVSGIYDLTFFPTLYKISGVTFIEMHRPVDLAMRSIGPIIFSIMLSLFVLLAILFYMEKSKIKSLLILVGILLLLGNTFVALKGNRPLNDLFLTWTPTTIPSNWSSLREEWLGYHLYRHIFNELQVFAILLIYFVTKSKSKTASV